MTVRLNSLAFDPRSFNYDKAIDIFTRGLATLDAVDTTPAIKFLACGGLVSPVLKADGSDPLEQALVMHVCRLLAVRALDPVIHLLQGAWPPASNAQEMSLWQEDCDAFHLADIDHITDLMTKDKPSIVLRQGVPNAQGLHVMDLFWRVMFGSWTNISP